MVVALVALFVALGGSAYAATTIGSAQITNESIRSQDIKNGEVKNADIGANAVRSGEIANGQVLAADIANGAVTPAKLGPVPAAVVMNAGTEAAATATGVTLHADSEIIDTDSLYDPVANTGNFVAPVSGVYFVSAIVDWDPSSVGYRRISIVGPNGAFASVAGPGLPSPAFTSQTASGIEYLAAGQTVHVDVLQGSGASLNVRLNRFEIAFLGR